MKLSELAKILNSHLIESAGVNTEFREGLKGLNSKMNWVLTLIGGCVVALLAALLRN